MGQQTNARLNFGGDLDRIQGLFFGFVTTGRYGKKVDNGYKAAGHTDSPDGRTAKTCLVEVCTVPVLLVSTVISVPCVRDILCINK